MTSRHGRDHTNPLNYPYRNAPKIVWGEASPTASKEIAVVSPGALPSDAIFPPLMPMMTGVQKTHKTNGLRIKAEESYHSPACLKGGM
jgi:hypothetical protein